MAEIWRFSCALRIIGFATAPQSLSATIVAARWISDSWGAYLRSSQTKISGSAIFSMILAIFDNPLSISEELIWGGNFFLSSMLFTRLVGIPARPIRRSKIHCTVIPVRGSLYAVPQLLHWLVRLQIFGDIFGLDQKNTVMPSSFIVTGSYFFKTRK